VPITVPSTLPRGPACDRYELLVTTRDPHPILVPIEKAHAPTGDIYFFRLLSSFMHVYLKYKNVIPTVHLLPGVL
jgi:hypothetical protein